MNPPHKLTFPGISGIERALRSRVSPEYPKGLVASEPFVPAGRGWTKAVVKCIATGQPRGTRWVKPKVGGGFEVRREAP